MGAFVLYSHGALLGNTGVRYSRASRGFLVVSHGRAPVRGVTLNSRHGGRVMTMVPPPSLALAPPPPVRVVPCLFAGQVPGVDSVGDARAGRVLLRLRMPGLPHLRGRDTGT